MSMPTLNRRYFLSLSAAALALPLIPRLARAATGEPVRIGVLAPLTGGGGPYGQGMANAAQKAAETINAAGGVLGGRPLEVVVIDDESNPTAGVAAVRKLLDVNKVIAIAGVWSSAVAMAIKPITLERGVPLLVSGSGDEVTQGDNKGLVYRFQARGSDWGPVFARAIHKAGGRRASVLALQTPFTLSLANPFAETFKAQGGEILDVVYYNPNQASYRAEVEKVFARKPDAVFVPSYLPDLSAIAREVYRSGFESPIYANSSAADAEGAFIKAVGRDVAEGIHHIQSIPPVNSSAYKRFAQAAGIDPATLAIFPSNVWDQISVLALAIEQAGSADPARYAAAIPLVANGQGAKVESPVDGLKALRAGQAVAYSGAGSQFTFTPNGDQLNREFGHFVIKNGANQLLEVLH
ncbi:Leucine-, isoleucine-, valine-, threonine-, and alanine-binding protein [Achromobacter deleyi]|uniref:Leucine-, isoleucine-, valine-, threonine-, and alanine-binding protein n=1 Tax=Achromobacter deleyi TaxID=1353891 RepID=A0A6S6Z9S4_9BURK|nr:ABC transporter substrate-binding protein [Achromobacter deleyi]CAB3665086.1 Leucine-, isoleucine-, valine-, threonine-, and alanine-binding protein [Achromobacter deleyi]CAB3822923.1 Leucine-, isoleucine-, valine-, threonine-, and alanine-binding protein [Achromobacter deleyi]CAB3834548.1 Leucine-, isoleucine-, valine-, threonine-, and alanine-binding protein [Achromobacter deleyi]